MIHLIYMPFGSITHPSLALGLFKAQLQEAGIPCQVHYFNLRFAQRIGFGAYETIAMFKGVKTQISEWLFAEQAWGDSAGPHVDEFLELCGTELGTIPKVADTRKWLQLVRQEVVPRFLRECVDQLAAAGNLQVVAFSCTFFQTIASLALGRLLKQVFPGIKLCYGGSCFLGEMGDELIHKVPWIDAVSVGETDDVIVPLLQALADDRPPTNMQGILYRRQSNEVIASAPYQPVTKEVLDALPCPNFDDFFTEATAIGLEQVPQWRRLLFLPFESSRGCWWGEKHHCAFCGLNGDGIHFRAKSVDKVLNTLTHFAERYPITHAYRATDNVLQNSYVEEFFAALQTGPIGNATELFYEVRVTLTRPQIRLMADTGVTCVQPGIESLSTHLLKLLRKGTTALQNVFFLKCCREYGILVNWNLLIRIPGETLDDYLQMEQWLPLLVHLAPPPGGCPKVECHRFSPYFDQKGRWLEHVRPVSWYRGLFPEDRIDLSRVAYYFDADWKNTLPDESYSKLIAATLTWIHIWRDSEQLPQLTYSAMSDGGLRLEDTRWGRANNITLSAVEASVYQAIDSPISLGQLAKKLENTAAGDLTPEQVAAVLERFISAELALRDKSFYLGIACSANMIDPPFEFRLRQFAKEPV